MNIIDKVTRKFKNEQKDETKIEKDIFTADQVYLQHEYNEVKSKLEPEIIQHIQNLVSSYPFFKDYAIYKIYKKFDFNRALVDEQIQVLIQSQKDFEWDNNSEQTPNDWIEITKNSKHALVSKDFLSTLKKKNKEDLLQMKKDRSFSPQGSLDRKQINKRRTKSEGRTKERDFLDKSPYQPKKKVEFDTIKQDSYSRNQEKDRERRSRRKERPRNESPSRKPKKNFEKEHGKHRVVYIPKVKKTEESDVTYEKKNVHKETHEQYEPYEKRNNVFHQRSLYVPKVQPIREDEKKIQNAPFQEITQERPRSRTPDKLRDIVDSSPNEQPVLVVYDEVKDNVSQSTPQNTPVDQSFSKLQTDSRQLQQKTEEKPIEQQNFEQKPVERQTEQKTKILSEPKTNEQIKIEQIPGNNQRAPNLLRPQFQPDDPQYYSQNIPYGYAPPIYQYPSYGPYGSYYYPQAQVQQPSSQYQFINPMMMGPPPYPQQPQLNQNPMMMGPPPFPQQPQLNQPSMVSHQQQTQFVGSQQPPMMVNPMMYQPQFINPPNFQLNLNYDSLISMMMSGQQQFPSDQVAPEE